MEAFSDGVFAVAITLLVLSIAVPEARAGDLSGELLRTWPLLVAYAASFLTIGIIWLNHHVVFTHIRRVDRPLLILNLLLLMAVVLMPFPTDVLGHYLQSPEDRGVAAAAYSVASALMGITFGAVWTYAVYHPNLLGPHVDVRKARRSLPRFAGGTLVYVACIGLAFVSAPLVVALCGLTAIYYAFNQIPLTGPPAD